MTTEQRTASISSAVWAVRASAVLAMLSILWQGFSASYVIPAGGAALGPHEIGAVVAHVTTGLLAFIAAWNEFMFALTFVLDNDQRTVPVSISLISGADKYEIPWGKIMAASVLVTLPLITLVLAFQRKIVGGLTSGAVKG